MRFYLDSAQPDEIRFAANALHVAGVTTNPAILQRARTPSISQLLDTVVATQRRDWKLWLQLRRGSTSEVMEQAEQINEALIERTGGLLAGPTIVYKLLPDREGLIAATTLIRQGAEVCLTGIANPTQALALSSLPEISEQREGQLVTEGPPASRNPHMPGYLACYVGRNDDAGRDGTKTVLRINDLLVANGRRTRVLAASIRTSEKLTELIRRLARRKSNVVDVTLSIELLRDLVHDKVTHAATVEFDQLEDIPL
jgi:transaldolase